MPLISKAFSNLITFSRTGGNATYFAANGVLTTAANNEPRFDYDPATFLPRGLLIEEQRTNSIRNNTMQGAVAGTPGTLPTNWFVYTAATGLTTSVVGSGTENGIAYVDVRVNGTAAGGSNIIWGFDSNTSIAASNGQTWAQSAYVKIQGGTTTGIVDFRIQNDERSASTYLRTNASPALAITTAALNTQRYSFSATLSGGGTVAFVVPYFLINFTVGVAIDITLRIGLPQLEQGAFATSVIPTTTTALTRNADVASVNTLSPWFNASAGTIYAESQQIAVQTGLTFPRSAQIDDGSNNNLITTLWRADLNRLYGAVTTGGVNQADVGTNGVTQTNANKIALAYATNDFAASTNGAAASTDTSGTVPTGLTILRLGAAFASATLNGYLRRVTYYPTRLSNAQLQTITT